MFKQAIIATAISLVSIVVYASSSQLFLLCRSESHGHSHKFKLIGGPYKTIAECDREAQAHRDSHLSGEYKTVQCSWNKPEVILKRINEGSLLN
ncbi:hypothetical protein [Acinetobacter chinensis]|uniref:hypothetical protein n=1 Tax=Acinetobacter chinensis TaxID=2004650 RepID=UPI0029350403|nr:hypothetical protein [Acinetobacter chinensis]WOE40719.1 hypothetical protein QSG87_12600 [Acinetobacter chinensis]